MLGSAVEVHPPVDLGGAHLVLEGQALLEGDEGIFGAHADQHPGRDIGRVLWPGGGQPGMEPDHGLEIGAAAGELEHHGPAEAVADRGDLRCVCSDLREQDVEAGPGQRPYAVGFCAQSSETGHHLVTVGEWLAAAVVVEREGHVPELGEPAGPVPLVVVEPGALVRDQHRRAPVVAVGERQPPDHGRLPDVVLDVSHGHHGVSLSVAWGLGARAGGSWRGDEQRVGGCGG